jgi:hypothetical protein
VLDKNEFFAWVARTAVSLAAVSSADRQPGGQRQHETGDVE